MSIPVAVSRMRLGLKAGQRYASLTRETRPPDEERRRVPMPPPHE